MTIPTHLQFWFFIAFFISFGVKVPMIPVHIIIAILYTVV